MKYPLCKINEIPSEGTKVIPFFGREVHVYKANDGPEAVVSIFIHFGGQLNYKMVSSFASGMALNLRWKMVDV